MTAAVVATAAESTQTSPSTSATVTMPSGIQTGDLLIVVAAKGGNAGVITISGWDTIESVSNTSATGALGIVYKFSNGGEGATQTISSTGASGHWAIVAFRLTGHHASQAPEVGTASKGSTGSGDPPNVSASWGAEDNRFIACLSYINDTASNDITGYPSGYTDDQHHVTFANSVMAMCGTASMGTTADQADDPGTFTVTTTDKLWVANTIVVRPAAAGGVAIPLMGANLGASLFDGQIR